MQLFSFKYCPQYSVFLFLAVLCYVSIGSCAMSPQQKITTRAYIAETDASWEITHGSLLGVSEIDFLTNKQFTIWIDVFKYDKERYFKILMDFKESGSDATFRPSHITIKLSNNEILKPKVLPCNDATAKANIQELRSYPTIETGIQVTKGACYYLFFDHPPPPVEEEIAMYMDDSLTVHGYKVYVPLIYFRKTIERKYHWGLFQ